MTEPGVHSRGGPQMTTGDRRMPRDKSVGAALVLTFLFGPFGLFYSGGLVDGALMCFGTIALAAVTLGLLGIGAIPLWAISMFWGAVAASNKHSRYQAWLATQSQVGHSRGLDAQPAMALPQPPPLRLEAPAPPIAPGRSPPDSLSVSARSAHEEEALRELKRAERAGAHKRRRGRRQAWRDHRAHLRAARSRPWGQRRPAADQCCRKESTVAIDVADSQDQDSAAAVGPVSSVACGRSASEEETTLSLFLSRWRGPQADAASGSSPCWLDLCPRLRRRLACRPRRTRKQGATEGHHSRSKQVVPLCFTVRFCSRPDQLSPGDHDAAGPRATHDLAVSSPPTLLYPDRIIVPVPGPCLDRIAAYGMDGCVFLAPADWTASDAAISADGGSSATLKATYSAAIAGQLDYEAHPNEPGVYEAAPYMPWVRAHWSHLAAGGPKPAAAPGLVEHPVRNTFVWYRRTSGLEVKRGLEVVGVARWSQATLGFVAWRRRCRRPTTTWPWPSLTSTSARRRAHSTACPSRSRTTSRQSTNTTTATPGSSSAQESKRRPASANSAAGKFYDSGCRLRHRHQLHPGSSCSDGRAYVQLRQHARRKPGAQWRHLGQLDARLPDGQSRRQSSSSISPTSQRLHNLAVGLADQG